MRMRQRLRMKLGSKLGTEIYRKRMHRIANIANKLIMSSLMAKRLLDKETRKKHREHFFLLDRAKIENYLKLTDNEIFTHLAICCFYGPDKDCTLKVFTIADRIKLET